jgi:hypothetical protein
MTDPTVGGPGPDQTVRDDWRHRERTRRAVDTGTVIWGLILIAVGGWFFLDHTLGFDLPRINWGDLWPVILLVIGGAVILQGLSRRAS